MILLWKLLRGLKNTFENSCQQMQFVPASTYIMIKIIPKEKKTDKQDSQRMPSLVTVLMYD